MPWQNPLESHILEARLENAHWLMTECGMTLGEAACRLGVPKACLEKELEREKATTT